MKIIGIVLLALLLLIFILTLFSIRVYVGFDKKGLRLSVKYLWLEVFKLDTSENKQEDKPADLDEPTEQIEPKPKPKEPEIEISEISEVQGKPEPQREQNPTEDKPESSEPNKSTEEPKEEKKGSSLLDKWNVIKQYLPNVKTALRKLLKLIKIDDLELYLTVGGEDASTAGINFGKINAVFYNVLALICSLFSVKIRKTEIKCDYEHKVFEANGSLLIKAKVLSILALAVYILINYIKVKSALDSLDKPETEGISRKKDQHERKEK
ncbi:MAG: DUF2953 domain-containing protein [Oscillospiraceae bacterium]|nr:DUF2953 domain-containing protein [Oscillospiraceae bacterium]